MVLVWKRVYVNVSKTMLVLIAIPVCYTRLFPSISFNIGTSAYYSFSDDTTATTGHKDYGHSIPIWISISRN